MRIFILICIVLILAGCNSYSIKRCELVDGIEVCSTAEIDSMRKFGDIAFKYNAETHTFELEASEVSTDSSAIITLAGTVLKLAEKEE